MISKIGHFPEVPSKPNAKQASKVYSKDTLQEMFFIICDSLNTEVTPNTLETIFLDLIPDYLPPDFVAEKAFKIYGHVNFPVDIESRLNLSDLSQENRLIVLEAIEDLNQEIEKMQISKQCLAIRDHLEEKNLSLPTLARHEAFANKEHVEDTLKTLGVMANNVFSTLDEKIAEIAFSEFFRKL